MLTTFPRCNFSLEVPEILSQNLICYHWLSVSGNSKIMHCGILINMPYCWIPYTYITLRECAVKKSSASLYNAFQSRWKALYNDAEDFFTAHSRKYWNWKYPTTLWCMYISVFHCVIVWFIKLHGHYQAHLTDSNVTWLLFSKLTAVLVQFSKIITLLLHLLNCINCYLHVKSNILMSTMSSYHRCCMAG